jgi:hypothetical protein
MPLAIDSGLVVTNIGGDVVGEFAISRVVRSAPVTL